jgi:hypothetical protein
VVGGDVPYRVHHPCADVQAENLFSGVPDDELSVHLNVVCVGHVEGPHAHFAEVCEEDVPPLAKESLPILMQFWRYGYDKVWYDLEWPTAIRLFLPMSHVTEMLDKKLKWTIRGRNLKSGIRLCLEMRGTCKIMMKFLSSGL